MTARIRYIGPAGHESPVFGRLEPGQTYDAAEAFAAYLVTTHPDYWQPADAPAATKE